MSHYIIKELPISERPRERLKEVGAENLTNIELLSIILKTGLPHQNVKEVAFELLKNYSF